MSRCEAWMDLLMECRYEAGSVMNGGRRMQLLPGQLLGAVSWLAARWNWTPKTVRGFLDKLENDGMIDASPMGVDEGKQKGKQATVLTICNYADYQVPNRDEGQAPRRTEGKQTASKGQAEGNIYKDNKGTREQVEKGALRAPAAEKSRSSAETSSDAFDEFWKAFPEGRKRAKAEAREIFEKIITGRHSRGHHAKAEEIIAAVIARRGIDVREPPMPSTWLNGARWLDDAPAGAAAAAMPPAAPWWSKPEQRAAMTDDRWRTGIDQFANGIWPVDKLGPPPGDPGCVVPRSLVRELKLEDRYTPGGISRTGGRH